MPIISSFFGIVISMFYDDHNPPHFHARYGEFQSTFDIQNLSMLKGNLPRRAQGLILDWAELRQKDLLENWRLSKEKKPLKTIEPLN